MITLTEELLLLAIDDAGEVTHTAGTTAFAAALLGAALIDLSNLQRIDLDLANVRLVSHHPSGLPHLDWVQQRLEQDASHAQVADPVSWLQSHSLNCAPLVRLALEQLVQRGILGVQDRKVFWIGKKRCYPVVQGQQVQEAKLRILQALLGEAVLPTPHDTALVGLARVGRLLEGFMSSSEMDRLQQRLDAMAGFDLVVRCVEQAIEAEQLNRAQALMFLR